MTDQTPIDVQQAEKEPQIPDERLRAAAQTTASTWQVTRLPQGKSGFEQRVQAARDALDMLSAELEGVDPKQFEDADPLLEIRENPRLLRAVVLEAYSIRRKVERLPRVLVPNQGEEARAAALSTAYLDAANSVWSPEAFHTFLDAAQEADPLELQELWVVPTMLKFMLLEWILTQAHARLHSPGSTAAGSAETLRTRIKTVRDVGYAAWASLIEELVAFEAILRQDPSGTYPRMDFDSREQYRKRVAEIARDSEGTESQVAAAALNLAKAAGTQEYSDERVRARRMHIGYYLVDKGTADLTRRVGYRPRLIDRLRIAIQRNADDFYIGSIEILTVVLIAVILLPLIPNYAIFGGLTVAFLLLLLPVTQGASDLVNNTVTALFRARALPKFDFSERIPAEYTTLVAVPSLLMNEKQVHELVSELEVRFLANRDPQSPLRPAHRSARFRQHAARQRHRPPRRSRSPPHQRSQCQIRIPEKRTFFLLHRHRLFNARQGVWMGWERKRGKLLDLNKLLAGEFDAFPIKAGHLDVLDECALHPYARLRHAAASRLRQRHDRRHGASAQSGDHRSEEAHRHRRLRHSAAARRRQRALGIAIAIGLYLFRPDRIRYLHARHLRRIPGSLW